MHRTSALILLLISFLSAPLFAQYQLVRKVYDTKTNTYAEVTCLTGKIPAHGYAPVRITINNGGKIDRDFSLDFTSSDASSFGSGSGSNITSNFSCSCDAGSSSTHDFMVPLVTIFQTAYSSSTQLSLKLSASGFSSAVGTMATEVHHDWPSVMLSDALFVANASRLDSQISGRFSYSGSIEFAGKFTPKELPTDWRGYIGQDHFVITSNEWKTLDPGVRTAVLEWNRLGGGIIIYTNNSSDNLASMQIDESAPNKKSIHRSLGHVELRPLPGDKQIDPSTLSKLVVPSATHPTEHHSLLHSYSSTWPLNKLLGEKNFDTVFFVLILLAFGILVGPINLFVFAKGGKRHKLFITTPIISLGASLLLIVIILFQDGFGGRGHRVLLMEISAEDNNAYIIQEQASRTGVLLGSSFETEEEAMITPLALSPSRWSRVTLNGRAPASYTANETSDGLKLTGDWFQSRSIHGHLLKTVRPTRGRIELASKAGAPVLTSTFDYDLDEIFYQAPDKTWWRAEALAKGNSVTLIPATATQFIAWLDEKKRLFSRHNAQQLTHLSNQPGHFYTSTDQAPAVETYNSIKWLTTTTIVTGKVLVKP